MLRLCAALVGVALVMAGLIATAEAQFFPFFGDQPRRQAPQPFRFGPLFGPPASVPQEAPRVDFSRAPPPRRSEATPTTKVVVMGDSMADWLAYGLEDAFAETPEIGIIRKHRSFSGLLRYETRTETTWAQVAREVIAAEKPSFVVMMLGLNDRAAIRERQTAAPAAAPKRAPPSGSTEQPADQRNDEQSPDQKPPDQVAENDDAEPAIVAPEPPRAGGTSLEYRSDRWVAAYNRRIADTIAALKSAGVPVIWVGLPSLRGARSTSDMQFLNDLYRKAAERANLVYADVWDGFVDEGGKFTLQGPDFEGQTRRLRAPDGVYFTRPGARKLAHFVEREIQRLMGNRAIPVALPAPEAETPRAPIGPQAPSGPAPRPLVGPVLPLTLVSSGNEELLGGAGARTPGADNVATRVLIRGEALTAPPGRADDFTWPRPAMLEARPGNDPVVAQPEAPPVRHPAVAGVNADGQRNTPAQTAARPAAAPQKGPFGAPRPPAPVGPSFGGGLFGLFR